MTEKPATPGQKKLIEHLRKISIEKLPWFNEESATYDEAREYIDECVKIIYGPDAAI